MAKKPSFRDPSLRKAEEIVNQYTDAQVLGLFDPGELDEIYDGDWDINDARYQLVIDFWEQNKTPL